MPKELENIVKTLKKEHPDWDDNKIWAIATSAYQKKKSINPKKK